MAISMSGRSPPINAVELLRSVTARSFPSVLNKNT